MNLMKKNRMLRSGETFFINNVCSTYNILKLAGFIMMTNGWIDIRSINIEKRRRKKVKVANKGIIEERKRSQACCVSTKCYNCVSDKKKVHFISS